MHRAAAVFTSERLKNKSVLRTLIFMTSIIPSTSIFFIFLGSLQYADRLIFQPLNLPPLEGFGLLLPFMALWSIGPGFLILYSAMESVPGKCMKPPEWMARVLCPIFLDYIAHDLSGVFFTLIVNLTRRVGGAVLLIADISSIFSLHQWRNIDDTMFTQSDLGYASALAWVTFAVMMTITFSCSVQRNTGCTSEEHDDNEI